MLTGYKPVSRIEKNCSKFWRKSSFPVRKKGVWNFVSNQNCWPLYWFQSFTPLLSGCSSFKK